MAAKNATFVVKEPVNEGEVTGDEGQGTEEVEGTVESQEVKNHSLNTGRTKPLKRKMLD